MLPGFSGPTCEYSCCAPTSFGSPSQASLPRRRKAELNPTSHPGLLSSQSAPTLPRPRRRGFTDAGLSTQHSDVDEIVFGTDIDGSNDAVKDVRVSRHFMGALGETSRQHDARQQMPAMRRGVECASSDMRAVIYAQAPAAAAAAVADAAPSLSPFEGAAGFRSSDRRRAGGGVTSLLEDAGLHPMLSDVDEIVFGRDLDRSNAAVKDVRRSNRFAGAAGGSSRHIAAAVEAASKRMLGPEGPWGPRGPRAADLTAAAAAEPDGDDDVVTMGARPPRRGEAAHAATHLPPHRPPPRQLCPMSRQVGDFYRATPAYQPPALAARAPPHALGASGLAAQWQAAQLARERAARHMLPF